MTGVSKRFPGVLALEDVHLEVGPSEIHALLGENGAGKSTLLKILSGAHSADAGEIELFGEPVAFATPHDAQRAGIVTIYQEFTLAPDMTIAENVFIGREPGSKLFVSWRRMAAETKAIAERIGLKRDPDDAGARSFRRRAAAGRDRPRALDAVAAHRHGRADLGAERSRGRQTSSRIVRALKAEGLSIIFVTHRLEEVFRLCDRYTVLRDGRYVASGAVADTNVDAIIRMMVGRDVGALYGERPIPEHGQVALEVEGLTRRRNARDPNAIELVDVSLKAHQRRDPRPRRSRRRRPHRNRARDFRRRSVRPRDDPRSTASRSSSRARATRCRTASAWCPEDRKKQALFLSLAIRTNITIAAQDEISRGWFIDERRRTR